MRYPDWPERLNKYILECQGREYELGKFDCAIFVCGAVEAMTGEDKLFPKYSTAEEAKKFMDQKPMTEWLATQFEPCHPAVARRGDIGVYENACGIVIGKHTILIGDPWSMVKTLDLEAAFRA